MHINEPSFASATLLTEAPVFVKIIPARALLSDATSLAPQGTVFPAAVDVHFGFPSGPGRTRMLFLTLLRLVLIAVDCCPTAVKAATLQNQEPAAPLRQPSYAIARASAGRLRLKYWNISTASNSRAASAMSITCCDPPGKRLARRRLRYNGPALLTVGIAQRGRETHPGGAPGLQIRRGALDVPGGFDSHSFPPYARSAQQLAYLC